MKSEMKDIALTKSKIKFLVNCRKFKLVPNHLNHFSRKCTESFFFYNSPLKLKINNRIVSLQKYILDTEISDLNFHLSKLKKSMCHHKKFLYKHCDYNLIVSFTNFYKLNNLNHFKHVLFLRHQKKFCSLLKIQKPHLTSFYPTNCTDNNSLSSPPNQLTLGNKKCKNIWA